MSDESFDEDAPLLDGGEDLPPGLFRYPEPGPGFREHLLARTASQVRFRARGRRALLACAVAAAYLIGVGSGFWLKPASDADTSTVKMATPVNGAQDTTSTASVVADAPSLPMLQDPDALARKLAGLGPSDRVVFLKLAGDRYLNDLNDMKLALGCYRQMLSKLPAGEAAKPQPNDTWLLTMLKQARTDEVSHDKPQA